MKVSFSFRADDGRRTLYFLRAFFKRPRSGLDALAKLAALEVAALQARVEVEEAERGRAVEALATAEPEAAPDLDAARKSAAEIMFDALTEIGRASAFFDDAKRMKKKANEALLRVERIVREAKQK